MLETPKNPNILGLPESLLSSILTVYIREPALAYNDTYKGTWANRVLPDYKNRARQAIGLMLSDKLGDGMPLLTEFFEVDTRLPEPSADFTGKCHVIGCIAANIELKHVKPGGVLYRPAPGLGELNEMTVQYPEGDRQIITRLCSAVPILRNKLHSRDFWVC